MAKQQRNEELFKDYKTGMAIVDLVVKYRISSTRIFQIIKRIKEIEKENL